jgi:hypothetical protein
MIRPAIITADSPVTWACASCAAEVFIQPGATLVDLESAAPLCEDCGFEVAPELVGLLRLGEAALMATALMDFGPRRDFAPGTEKVC